MFTPFLFIYLARPYLLSHRRTSSFVAVAWCRRKDCWTRKRSKADPSKSKLSSISPPIFLERSMLVSCMDFTTLSPRWRSSAHQRSGWAPCWFVFITALNGSSLIPPAPPPIPLGFQCTQNSPWCLIDDSLHLFFSDGAGRELILESFADFRVVLCHRS